MSGTLEPGLSALSRSKEITLVQYVKNAICDKKFINVQMRKVVLFKIYFINDYLYNIFFSIPVTNLLSYDKV